MHSKCRQRYTLKRGGTFSYNDFGTDGALKNIMCSPVKSKVRKSTETFDYKNLCIICGQVASISDKTSKSSRNTISIITDPGFQVNLVKRISSINTTLGKTVLRRIVCVCGFNKFRGTISSKMLSE